MNGAAAQRLFTPIRLLRVELVVDDATRLAGRLAWRERAIYFEYDPAFLTTKLDLSPFNLPLKDGLVEGPVRVFEGLHGLFNDSLPDGWGRLLMDRQLRSVGIQPGQLTPLDRLAWVGRHGMGALSFRPEHPQLAEADDALDLDRLADEARLVLADSPRAVFDRLLKAGGSAQGARPKALVGRGSVDGKLLHGVDDLPAGYEHWIVKFRAKEDPLDIGAVEYAYADMAREAGVAMPPTMLFPAKSGPGYFGTKRFDRVDNRRIHMHTISGLLQVDHALPSIGYEALLKATRGLTRRQGDVEQIFARMVFNVLAHNRDDHTKNHSFLMDGKGAWSASPAYDVTFSSGPGGEHALDIAGEGREPGVGHMLKVAMAVGIDRGFAAATIDRVRGAVDRWPILASQGGVSKRLTGQIDKLLNGARGKRPRAP